MIAENPAVMELPADRARPVVLSNRYASRSQTLPQDLATALNALSQREGVANHTLFLAAFKTLLFRYANPQTILVGWPVPGRTHPDNTGMAEYEGCAVALRTDVSDNPTFRDLLRRVNRAMETAVRKLADDSLSTLSLNELETSQVLFHWQEDSQCLPKWALIESAGHETLRYELALLPSNAEGTWACALQYSTDLFDEETIDRMLGHFQVLLRGIVDDPEQRIGHLPLLTRTERDQLLGEWNDTRADFPRNVCLHHLFERQVERDPTAVAVIYDHHQLTYAELNVRANQLSHYLRKLGIGPDMMVGVCIERSLEMVVGLMAILKAGAAYVPIDPAYPPERIAFMLEDTQVPVLFTQKRLLDKLPSHHAKTVCLDSDGDLIAREDQENPASGVQPENLAYVIYTSGSTGRPKGVMLDHLGRVNNFCDFNQRFAVTSGDRLLAVSSLSFDMCAYDVFGVLAAGGTTVIVPGALTLDSAYCATLMEHHKITIWHSVPAILKMIVEHITHRPELHPHCLRLVLLGGDWIPVTLADQLRAMAKDVRVIGLGGATEASMDSTIYEIDQTDPNWKSVPYGAPMANQRAYVLDQHDQLLPVGVPGELHLGGIGIARGYLNQPELTREKFIPDPFDQDPQSRMYRTGDLARFRGDGNLELLGRIDLQVKIRGFRIELGEIEATLRQHPAVEDCVVVARGERSEEKRLAAYVLQDAQYLGDNEEVRAWHDAQMSQWQMVYDTAYSKTSESEDPVFNIASWDSSYTGQPIPTEEMREWVEETVARIRALAPTRVLEIGCGLGLILFRIAPHCEKYHGTDFSKVALDHIKKHLDQEKLSDIVTLSANMADDYRGIEAGSLDAVVLNSVVLDFPGVEYLVEVLKGAAKAVEPGGVIFVGDVRSVFLMEAFQTSVELHRAPAWLSKEKLRQRVRKKINMEEELLIDPMFFAALAHHIPEIGHVHIQLKRGRFQNELINYRYDATLHIGPGEASPRFSGQRMDWEQTLNSLEAVHALLHNDGPEELLIEGVPNARIIADIQATKLLADADGPKTVGEIRERLDAIMRTDPGIHPESFWQLSESFPYMVDIRYSSGAETGCYDVYMTRQSNEAVRKVRFPSTMRFDPETPLNAYVNDPLQAKHRGKLAPELRTYLERRLPSHMIPSAFVLLDSFPLSPNGKVDRRALPEPDLLRPDMKEVLLAPSTATESVLAGIWSEVLGLEAVGVRDNFFELGGHSLLAAQVISRIRDLFQINVPLLTLFESSTITDLANSLHELGREAHVDIAGTAETVTQINKLSDEEVSAMLAETGDPTLAQEKEQS